MGLACFTAASVALTSCGDDAPRLPDPEGQLVYTPLAAPLLAYLAQQKAEQVPSSPALARNILLAADTYGDLPRILTANYGFDGYMGVPELNGTDAAARNAAYAAGVAWQVLDPALNAPTRALYSAVGTGAFLAIYGVPALRADTIPVVFSHPVLPATVRPEAFRITLNTGETVTPIAASFLPNLEYNERQTVVLTGYWGNRLEPGQSGALYPTRVDVVPTPSPMMLVTPAGFVPAAGLGIESRTPYQAGNGPRMLAAKLNIYSSLGEGGPQSQPNSYANSGEDLYGTSAKFRLRIYTSAGFSPDGIGSLLPTDYARYFLVKARDQAGRLVELKEAGQMYGVPGYGSVRVVGLADTGLAQSRYDEAYVEDHDNQYDIILDGDLAAMARIVEVQMPSSGAYRAVYNPGGPGNQPGSNPPGVPFTVPSQNHSVAVTNDLTGKAFVSYVEVDGDVTRHPVDGQPMGRLLGPAVIDTRTGYVVHAYLAPSGRRFFSSIPVHTTP